MWALYGNAFLETAVRCFAVGETPFELRRQLGLHFVFGDADGVLLRLERILDLHIVLLGAEDNADRRTVVGGMLGVFEEIEVEVHQACELGLEGAEFQIIGDVSESVMSKASVFMRLDAALAAFGFD